MGNDLSDSQLSAYLDGELSDAQRLAVEAALGESAELRQSLAELRQLREAFHSLPQYKLGSDFASRVLQAAQAAERKQQDQIAVVPAIQTESAARPASRRRWLYAAAGLAGLAASVLLIAQLSNNGGPTEVAKHAPDRQPLNGVAESSDRATAAPEATAPDFTALRALASDQGEALILRVRVPQGTSPQQAIDAALAQTGIATRSPAETTAAGPVGAAYRTALREQVTTSGPQAKRATDAVFIEASLGLVEDALATLASEQGGKIEFQPEMKVAIAPSALPSNVGEGEGEDSSGSAGEKSNRPSSPFAQRLNPRIFRLPSEPLAAPTTAEPVPTAANANRKVRVLILVETVEP